MEPRDFMLIVKTLISFLFVCDVTQVPFPGPMWNHAASSFGAPRVRGYLTDRIQWLMVVGVLFQVFALKSIQLWALNEWRRVTELPILECNVPKLEMGYGVLLLLFLYVV